MGQKLIDRTAAALVLRSLMRSFMDGADARILEQVTERLRPGDMFQVEYMMILEAVQALRGKGAMLSLSAIQAELKPNDPACFALIVLDLIVERREQGPNDLETVGELIEFLVSFRAETHNGK